jgi:protein-tyrosine-phosphatase
MAGAIVRTRLHDVEVTTAGTHVIEGMPMSWRTRDALASIGVTVDGHRSRQLRAVDLDAADLVVAMAREHVSYIRRVHPEAAKRTATLRRLARDLGPGPEPLADRLAALDLDAVPLEPWEDVADPAGGEIEEFVACVQEIDRELRTLALALGESPGGA